MVLNKCVFLDRDGVLNRERGQYTYTLDTFEIIEGVPQSLEVLKKAGFLLIVITNQAGIAKGIYEEQDVQRCHSFLQAEVGNLIDDIYFCPHHPITTKSLLRKPDSLMLEKAIAKWKVDVSASFMVGDSNRDVLAGQHVGLKSILVGNTENDKITAPRASDLLDAVTHFIL